MLLVVVHKRNTTNMPPWEMQCDLNCSAKRQRFKRLYFDETLMLELDPFAREVSLQQDWGWEVMPFTRDVMTKLTTDLCGQNECPNERSEKAGAIFSSLHEELSIFIDHGWFVFATLMRDLVYNIALTFETASNVQDICDANFSTKAGVDRFLSMRMKITMNVLARLRLQEVWFFCPRDVP